jgi:mRNA interferase MazF
VQGDHLNRSKIAKAVCVPLTSNLAWANAPGNVLLPAKLVGLPKDSVANVSQIVAVDRQFLTERCGRLPARKLALVLSGIDVVLPMRPPNKPMQPLDHDRRGEVSSRRALRLPRAAARPGRLGGQALVRR